MLHYYTVHIVKTEELDKEDENQDLNTESFVLDEEDVDEETIEAVRDLLSERYPDVVPSLMYQDSTGGMAREVGLIYTIEDEGAADDTADASRSVDWVTVREITSKEVSPSALGIVCEDVDA